MGAGPSGRPLDFRHSARSAPATLDDLARLLTNVCSAVPGGVVVFFPSFSYADQAHARWAATGALRALGAKKRVLREPRSAGEVEACLTEYAACCREGSSPPQQQEQQKQQRSGGGGGPQQQQQRSGGNCNGGAASGAMMLCVVGGKLAEGINFGDALGRCAHAASWGLSLLAGWLSQVRRPSRP